MCVYACTYVHEYVIFIHSVNSASQGTSSEVSGHGKKILTTSFGSGVAGSATSEGRLSKDKSEALGMCFKGILKDQLKFMFIMCVRR